MKKGVYEDFDGASRFDLPEGIYRVTGGEGGEAFLIDGGEKTALYDCGMAYCADNLIENIEKVLEETGKKGVDYILLSHSHYDHIGALPYIKKRWPKAISVGAEKAAKVFRSEGARATMKQLGEAARDRFGSEEEKKKEVITEGMICDLVIGDGHIIDLGEKKIECIETKGHTDCCMSFFIVPDKILIASESTGVLTGPGTMEAEILKSFNQAYEAVEKCRALKADRIIVNHYGIIPKFYNEAYFDLFIEKSEEGKIFIENLYEQDYSLQEILESYKDRYFTKKRSKKQPVEAFYANARPIIATVIREYEDRKKGGNL